LTVPRELTGQRLRVPSAGLLMSRKMASILHAKQGDWVTMTPTKGRRESRRVQVVAISDAYIGLSVYTQLEFLSELIGEEYALTGAQLRIDCKQPTEPLNVRSLWFPPPPLEDRLERRRRVLYRELKELPSLQIVVARSDTIANVRDTLIKNQQVFIAILVLFAGIIFFGSVLNSSLVSLAERQREVATLRVLGYTPWQVGGLFARESMLTTLLGTLCGMPLGYYLNVGITIAYDTEMFRIPVVDPRMPFLYTLILGLVFGGLAQAFVQRSIFRQDWLEALKTKE
jgi:putative ABC transport system permease protein